MEGVCPTNCTLVECPRLHQCMSPKRKCPSGGQAQGRSAFSIHRGKRTIRCNTCITKMRLKVDPVAQKASRKKYLQAFNAAARAYKIGKKCIDCGCDDPDLLAFLHRTGTNAGKFRTECKENAKLVESKAKFYDLLCYICLNKHIRKRLTQNTTVARLRFEVSEEMIERGRCNSGATGQWCAGAVTFENFNYAFEWSKINNTDPVKFVSRLVNTRADRSHVFDAMSKRRLLCANCRHREQLATGA
jgi:hypothetical protein